MNNTRFSACMWLFPEWTRCDRAYTRNAYWGCSVIPAATCEHGRCPHLCQFTQFWWTGGWEEHVKWWYFASVSPTGKPNSYMAQLSRQNIKNKIKHWVDNQHLVMWHGPSRTPDRLENWFWSPFQLQRPDFCPLIKRAQSRVVIGLTRHDTLRRDLYLTELSNNPTCRNCGTQEENSSHILCEYEAVASLRHANLCSFFMYPEDIRI